MLVHTLELADHVQLGRAFEKLLDQEGIQDCAIELDALRIRFIASEERAAHLIERIAQQGGLRTAAREWIDLESLATGARARHAKRR